MVLSDPAGPERRAGRTEPADVEGYLALAFALALFGQLRLPPLHAFFPEAIRPLVQPGWLCLACGLLFGLSGVRRGRGDARGSAWLALAVLSLYIALIVL